MYSKQLTSTAVIAVLLISATSSAAPAKNAAKPTLQQCIASEAKRSDFSGVVLIGRPGGSVLVSQGYLAGKGSPKMLPNAQFNIGSAGKMWTAVAVAQLVDAQKIKLDDTIGLYVTGLTEEASAVTIKQLLTHSGGLGNFFTPDNMELFKRAKNLSDLKPLLTFEKPMFTPGTKSQYSNSGFLLLGLLVEKVSGQNYGDYLQERIFKPAGMKASGLFPASPKARASGMTNWPEIDEGPDGPLPGPPPGPAGPPPSGALPAPPPGAQPGPPPGGPSGPMLPPPGPLRPSAESKIMGTSAGGSYSTPSDMQRFFAALLSAQLTSPAMLKALTSSQVELLPAKGALPAVYYGLGFAIADHAGHRGVGHNGGLPGGNVATFAFSDDQTTAVVMTNRDPPAADMMLRKVQAMLFDGGTCGRT